jgi:hypothetical protein
MKESIEASGQQQQPAGCCCNPCTLHTFDALKHCDVDACFAAMTAIFTATNVFERTKKLPAKLNLPFLTVISVEHSITLRMQLITFNMQSF